MLSLLVVAAALADEPVLYEGDPAAAIAQIAASADKEPWQLEPIRPVDLVGSSRVTLLGAPPPCAARAPSTSAELRVIADRAAHRIQRQEWAEARRDVEQARAALGCLVEEADADRAAHIHLMWGVLATGANSPKEAAQAFDRAHRFRMDANGKPTLEWDARLAAPDMGADAFAQAADRLSKAGEGALLVAPGVDPSRVTLRMDGRTLPLPAEGRVALTEGYHLIQILTRDADSTTTTTVEVDIKVGQELVLIDPVGFGRIRLSEQVLQPGLAQVVRATVAPEGIAWAFADGAAWRLDEAWTRLEPVDLGDAARAQRRSSTIRGVGLGAMVLGGAGAVVGFTHFSGLRTPQAWETTTEGQDFRTSEAMAWRNLGFISAGVGVVGGVVAGIGHARVQATASSVSIGWAH
jgi:hypothetical protein